MPQNRFLMMFRLITEKRGLLLASSLLAIISTFLSFTPFVSVYYISAELLRNAAHVSASDFDFIRLWGVIAFVSMLLSFLFLYASAMCSHVSAFHILYGLRMKLAAHLGKLPMRYFTTHQSGAIKKVLGFSVEEIETFIAHQIPDCVAAVCIPAILFSILLVLDWRLGLACALPVTAAFVLQSIAFSGKRGREAVKQYHSAMEQMNAAGVEYVRGMPEVKIFGLTAQTFGRFKSTVFGYRDWVIRYTYYCRQPYIIFTTILSSILVFVLPAGILIYSGRPHDLGFALVLLLFLIFAPGLSIPVIKLMYLGSMLGMIATGVEGIKAILAEKPLPEPAMALEPDRFDLSFTDVSFTYPTEEGRTSGKAIDHLSFTARQNAVTALVGPSGSGKSTIANLTGRFWDVDEGSIQLGGIDIRSIPTSRLMELVSFVFQDVHIFDTTVEENIRMGNTRVTKEEVEQAARSACCHDFIMRLAHGYQTELGRNGIALSGGQAQRIGIARALLRNAPVLILDEPTAFADAENEINIQQGITALIQDKTVLVITHRFSTIHNAHHIVVLDRGRLVEQGTHAELLANEQLYRHLWRQHKTAASWILGESGTMDNGQSEKGNA